MGKKTYRSWYRRTFDVPSEWDPKNRVLLNFGAVDYETNVWINGQNVTWHEGGYWAFEVDVTDYLVKNGTNELYVSCASQCCLLICVTDSFTFGTPLIRILRDPH
jgi:beta-galactosidase/beta-glucuronidase